MAPPESASMRCASGVCIPARAAAEARGLGLSGDGVPEGGFGPFQVPDMPVYRQGKSQGGLPPGAMPTPTYMRTRWSMPRYPGGAMPHEFALASHEYLLPAKQRRGAIGLFEKSRWPNAFDGRGNYGMASLDASRYHQVRTGRPRTKRADILERTDYFARRIVPVPGITHTQPMINYDGRYYNKRRARVITRDLEPWLMQPVIEHNPLFIHTATSEQLRRNYAPDIDEVEAVMRT